MNLNFQGRVALQILVGQSCGSASFSPSARAAWLTESGRGNPKARTSLRSFCQKFGRRGSAALPLLAVMILLFAVGARAETTNALSDAAIQGHILAQQLCEMRPETNFTQSAILVIRPKSGRSTSNSITCQIFVTQKNWTTIYTPNGAPPVISTPFNKIEYVITHAGDGGNIYTLNHSNPFTHGEQPVSSATPIAGSDFWFGDLGLEFFRWPQQRILPKTINLKRGRAYTLLESTNPNPSTNGYSRVLSWIDQETGGILQAEAYDAQGKLLKVFEPDSFEKVNGQWQLQEIEIRNVQTGSRTRLTFDLKK